MKRPNPIFLGVIALVALLPHAPRLLPGPAVDLRSELQPTRVEAIVFDKAQTEQLEMPTAELPPMSAEDSDCANSGLDDNKDLRHNRGVDEKMPDLASKETSENCDAAQDVSPQNFLSVHLASAGF